MIKAAGKNGWKQFAEIHKIDLAKSVLMDDSRSNCRQAKELGMTVVRISKLDSFLENSPFQNIMYKSLSGILGVRMSQALNHLSINYGQKVDIKALFKTLLDIPERQIISPTQRAIKKRFNNIRNT